MQRALAQLKATVVLCSFIEAGSLLAQAPVLIRGRVFRADGTPLAGAQVKAFPLEAFSGVLPFAMSMEDGSYRLLCPFKGRLRLIAMKEGSGYPDTTGSLFAPEPDTTPMIEISDGDAEREVDLHLPPPDGSISVQIVNAVTQEPVPFSQLTLQEAQNPQVTFSTSIADSRFSYDLPEKDIRITIRAQGFNPLELADERTGSTTFRIQSIDHLNVTAKLIPNP